ncbi:MAG: nitrilase-related carbon-nitrogen hydrolase, partial [Phycisphaerales bacterium]|nr:nitrilase-related carbon-nitrogen hydrolase [Phycisphaerales bacterium]
ARLMALAGAELLLYPTAIGWDPRDDEDERRRQREAWITVQRGHAIANGLPVLACNRVGHEPDPEGGPGILFWGSSFAAGPQGELLAVADADRPATLTVRLDLRRGEAVRQIWPFLRDRRIDAYGELLAHWRDG